LAPRAGVEKLKTVNSLSCQTLPKVAAERKRLFGGLSTREAAIIAHYLGGLKRPLIAKAADAIRVILIGARR
jgi:hypothetical protein